MPLYTCAWVSLGYKPSGITWSSYVSISSFIRQCLSVFQNLCTNLCSLSSVWKKFNCSESSPALGVVVLFEYCQSGVYVVVVLVSFLYICLITNETECLFVQWLAIWICYFVEAPVQIFWPVFSISLPIFFPIDLFKLFMYLEYQSFISLYELQIHSLLHLEMFTLWYVLRNITS